MGLKDELRSCDKLDHFLRSIFHQPNHRRHLERILEGLPGEPYLLPAGRIPEYQKKHIKRDGRR